MEITDMKSSIRALMLASLALSSLALTACNTVEGAGKDVEKAGEVIQDEAND
jgi:predicted small secreted protein